MRYPHLVATLVLLLSFTPDHAGNMVCDLKNYSYEEGLSHSTITGIVQDQHGLMWFGTWNGLSSFDGYLFRNYRPYPGDGCTMMNSRINRIALGHTGDIWCINQDLKAYLFDVRQHKFLDVLEDIQTEMHQDHTVREIFTLPKGVTWVVCDDGFSFRVNDAACKLGKDKPDTAVIAFGNADKKLKGSIISIVQDSEGDEWVMTDKGVTIVGRKKLNSDFPFHFFIEIGKTIWLGTADGRLAKYLPNRQTFRFVNLPGGVSRILALQSTDSNELAVCSDQGLILIDVRSNALKAYSVRTAPGQPNEAQYVYKDSQGGYWVLGAIPGVIWLDHGKRTLLQATNSAAPKADGTNRFLVFEDSKKQLWVIPRDGQLSYLDRASQKLRIPTTNVGGQQLPALPLARTFLLDKQGNLWCGSNTSLSRFSISFRNFTTSTFPTGEAEVRALHTDHSGRIWVAAKDGMIRVYDKHLGNPLFLTPQGQLQPGAAVFGPNIYDILEDRSGNIWLGSKQYGLYLLTPAKQGRYVVQHFLPDENDPYSLNGSSVYTMFQDSRHRIWSGTFEGGLNLVTKDANGKVQFINAKNRLKNYPLQFCKGIRHISEKDGIMLLGTTNGLLTFSVDFGDPEAIRFYRNTRRPDDVRSLSGNDVMFLFTDSRKQTYVITQNAGVNRIESRELLSDKIDFQVFNERSGLASDLTRSMIEDRSGKLWIVSKHMITRFDPKQQLLDNYGSHSFRENFIFSESAVLKDQGGNILIGTSTGLFQFDPTRMIKRDYAPSIILTGLKIQGVESKEDADRIPKLVLKSNQRNLIIQFAALDYQGSDQIKYAYKLEGVDDDWHEETTNRSAVYLNLPHGKLRFVVKSTNSDGAWVANERSLPIVVRPTFWETPWSWLLLLVFIAIIVLVVVRVLFTIYRLRHEVDVEQHLSDIKLKFFTDVSHELRTPLTLIASPINEVIENEELSEKAKQHLSLVQKNVSRLLQLVNQILDFRKIQNKRMKMLVEETDVILLLRRIMDNFKLISEEKAIMLELVTTETHLPLWLDRDKFEKIIFNLLSNAFKYSQDGKSVRVHVVDQGDHIQVSVYDEGIGIPAGKLNSVFKRFEMFATPELSQQSSGIGLSLVKELVELHHGSIEVFSKLGEGSEFRMTLPKGKEHFLGEEQTEFILDDQEPSAVTEEPEVEFTDEDRHMSQTILVVEDNLELLQFLKDIFSRDFRVITAHNGQEGLEKTLDMLPDLVVCDVMMPVMDGLEMIRRIKDNKDVCHIPIIILTAKDSIDDRIIGLERGIDDYITKPFSASYLRMRIKTLLQQRRALQEAFLSNLQLHPLTTDSDASVRLMPADPKITNFDEQFIQEILDFMEKNMDNTALTVDDIAVKLSMSRTVFYKKVKSLLGLTPIDLIKDIRVKRSVQLIESSAYSFSEIAYMSGFSDPNYFGKCFKKIMGMTPTKYKERFDAS